MPRKKFEVTDKDRHTVKALASYGIPQVDIGKVIGCSHVRLRRCFAAELETAEAQANAKVAETLFSNAINPDPRYQASRFFWLKTRAKWRETHNVSMVDADGKDAKLSIADARALIRDWKPDEEHV